VRWHLALYSAALPPISAKEAAKWMDKSFRSSCVGYSVGAREEVNYSLSLRLQ
jgi:hypothetical protein